MKKIFIGLALITAVGTFTSCKDFLEEAPELKQSNEITLGSYEGLNNATAGLYSMMQSASWYDGAYLLQSELRCGNAKNPISDPGSGRYLNETQWNFNESSTSPLWSYAYYTIARACNVINNVEGKETSSVTTQDLNNLKAEALFMRALCHFDLVITYAQPYTSQPESLGVPVITVTENALPARNTVKEVYDQITADLLEAESIIEDGYTRSGVSDAAAMVSKEAIQALLSRVYLYMGEWQKSADYATKVINSGKYSLADATDYLAMWSASAAPKGGEIIFEVFGSKKNEYWDESGWTHLPYITGSSSDMTGSGDICATEDLHSLYEAGDVRLDMFKKHETDWVVTKYSGKEGSNPKETNVPILRLAEMYLNRAEAIVYGATISGVTAQSDLNAIASKRGATAPSPSKTAVFNERRKELFFEGHIAYDYARTGTSLTRSDFDGSVNKDVPFPSYMWAMPIPKRELDANPNMEQNPGY